jgi:MscS family membrane protein
MKLTSGAVMKIRIKFFVRAFSIILIIFLLQGVLLRVNAGVSPIAPPSTQSPQATYSAFMTNMNDAYSLIMEAHQQSQAEGGMLASAEVENLAAQAEEAMERAIETLNLQNVPLANQESQGIESALLLREILDRIEKPDIASIPDAQSVQEAGIDRWEIPDTQIAIVQITEGFREDEFLFSEETLKHLPLFYSEVKDLPYQEDSLQGFYEFYISTPGSLLPPKWSNLLPRWSKYIVWEQTLWQWASLFILVLLAIAAINLAYRLTQPAGRNLNQHDLHSQALAWRGLLLPATIALTCAVSEHLIINVINLTGSIVTNVTVLLEVLFYVALAWLGFMFFNAVGRSIIACSYFDDDHLLEAAVVRNGFRILGVFAAITLLYVGGQKVGLPTGPLVASLGVGGLAISFGVQPYLKNLIGGMTLFANRPVKIGDFCELGGVTGTVEDIGLRTTAIRTPDRNLVIIPNAVVSESQVVNYSKRDRRLMKFVVGIRYETRRQQLLDIISKIKTYLELQELVDNERVRFVGFGDSSLDIEVFAYILTTDYAEFLEIQENILVRIMEIIEAVGSDFAFPSQTLYLSRDGGIAPPPQISSQSLPDEATPSASAS